MTLKYQERTFLKYPLVTLLILACLLSLAGCENDKHDDQHLSTMKSALPTVSEKTKQALNAIGERSILFAHHSVGSNIIDGIRQLTHETGQEFNIANINEQLPDKNVHLLEFSPGNNANPVSKIKSFFAIIRENKVQPKPDIVLLKLCYVDIVPETENQKLMRIYKESVGSLKQKNPDMLIAHITVPLTACETTIKARIKRLLGVQVWGDAANIQRARFNSLLFQTFPDAPIFNLAEIESTRQDNSKAAFIHQGETYNCLAPEYSDDGGHLNTLGKRIVAANFVEFLADSLKLKGP